MSIRNLLTVTLRRHEEFQGWYYSFILYHNACKRPTKRGYELIESKAITNIIRAKTICKTEYYIL